MDELDLKDRMVIRKDGGKRVQSRSLLLGVGFDGEDGHTRITRGEEFYLVGGSKPTHETMQEKAVKFTEELKKRGRKVMDLTREEFYEIADRLDMGAQPDK